MKTTADRGYAYQATFGTAIIKTSAGGAKKGWHKILSKGTTGTGNILPTAIKVGDVFYLASDGTPGTGEKTLPITLTKACFINSLSVSASREKQDVTTWCDSMKDYIVSAIAEQTGSASGYFEDESRFQESIFGQFTPMITQDGSTVTRLSPNGNTVYLMQSIREKDATTAGEVITWRWMPMIIDSMDMNTEGATAIPFNFNFTLKGSENPMTIKVVVQ